MTRRVFESTLKAHQGTKPFKPFLVELMSGTQLEVRHPEGLIAHAGSAAYIAPDGTLTIFDAPGVTRISQIPSRRSQREA